MLLGEIDGIAFAPDYPELAGTRVMVTGAPGPLCDDILRSFADARTRLAVIAADGAALSHETRAFVQSHAMAAELLTAGCGETGVAAVRTAVQRFGGVDTVINVVQLDDRVLEGGDEPERLIGDLLMLPCLATRIAANRMSLTLTPGSILNIVTGGRQAGARIRALAAVVRATLAGFTRSEAQTWGRHGIRINAIAPGSEARGGQAQLSRGPDVASLALHLASAREHALSGLTFEAYAA
jgi:3-oxoacyl-[acyl-carrier protein] reductase